MRATRTPVCARRAAAPSLPAVHTRRGRTTAPPQWVAPSRNTVRLRFVPPHGVRDHRNLQCGGREWPPRRRVRHRQRPPQLQIAHHTTPPTPQLAPPPAALPAALTAAVNSVRSSLSPLLASPAGVAAVVGAVVVALAVKKVLDTPSRKYDPANPNVGSEYDAWTKCVVWGGER